MRDRVGTLKKFIKKYIEDQQVPEDQKVVIVGHFVIFSHYTAIWEPDYGRDQILPQPENCIKMKNCQFVSDPTDFDKVEME